MEALTWQVPGRTHELSTPAAGGLRRIRATEALSLDQPCLGAPTAPFKEGRLEAPVSSKLQERESRDK